MSPQKSAQRSQGTEPLEKSRRASQSNTASSQPKLEVRSVLIEPRHNEPPRISVSVEYESEAPSVQALKKAAMGAIHDVVRRASAEGKLEDLGERHDMQRKQMTKCFSLEDSRQ